MTLTPIKTESIFKSDDPEFNHKAAEAAYDLIMKMDDDSAAEFVRHVVNEVIETEISENLSAYQRRVDQVVSKRMETIKKATLRASVSKGADAIEFTQALSLIEKASRNPYDYGYTFNESDFRRDQGGRFRAKVVTTQRKPLSNTAAAAFGVPTTKEMNRGRDVKLSAARQAAFQDQYRQLAGFLSTVNASSANPGNEQVIARVRDRRTGQEAAFPMPAGTRTPGGKNVPWDAAREDLIELEVSPSTLTAGGAYFGLTSALGHAPDTRAAQRINNLDERGFRTFSDDWTRTGDVTSSNARRYDRVRSGSRLVSDLAPPGSKAQLAGQFGQFVGSHGAEAERVIGPSARKAAYRYRGTERAPDKELIDLYGPAIQRGKMDSLGSRSLAPPQMAAARESATSRAPTWTEREHGRRQVLDYLWNQERRPNQRLYALQLASGNTPPSEGVMINKDGQIVAQAIGYGDDHYVPFNLKNLKSLKGGEYVRTRSVGGLTSEDVYTGLMSGARQVTVVSRSGVFTMEFQEDFRGGRRHNDKALRMTRRYEQILDAVQSEQVDRKSLNPEIQSAIRRQINEQFGGEPAEERSRMVRERVEEFKRNPEFSDADEDLANIMVNMHSAGGSSKDRASIRSEVMNQLAEEKEYKFRLNGDGYAAGLKALEEQFPYYIKTRSIPNRNIERTELEVDQGYVEPGRNRPTRARAGYYGTKENKGEKFSASHADFQRGKYGTVSDPARGGNLQRQTAEQPKTEDLKGPDARFKLKPDADEPERVAQNIRAKRERGEAGRDLRKVARATQFDDATKAAFPEIFALSDEEFETVSGDAATVTKLNEFVDKIRAAKTAKPASIPDSLNTAVISYKAKSVAGTSKFYNDAVGFSWPPTPFEFTRNDGPAYKAKPMAVHIESELGLLGHRYSSVADGRPINQLSVDELKTELSRLKDINEVRKMGSYKGDARRRLMGELGLDPMTGTKAVNEDQLSFNKRVRGIHQMRWLKTRTENAGMEPTKGTGPTPGDLEEKLSGSAENYTRLAARHDEIKRLYDRSTNLEQTDKLQDALNQIENAMKESKYSDTEAVMGFTDEILRNINR